MMNKFFDLVCLFGFSPHFSEIAIFLDATGIECFVVFGPRQKKSIDSLVLPESVEKLCIQDLNDSAFKEIGIRDRRAIGMSFGSPFIFTQGDIDDFGGQLINSHGAPLPDFKGGGGFSWRILQRDKRGSSLMHYVTTKIDEGACVFRKDFLFSADERMPGDLERRQFKEESKHLVAWIKKVLSGQVMLERSAPNWKASDEPGSYFPRISSELHGCINWSLKLIDLESFVLAFSKPYPGAYTFLKGQKVRIFDFRIERECHMHPFTYGLVFNTGPEKFLISCNGGIISVKRDDLRIEAETDDFRVNCGDRFCTPDFFLQKALCSRVFYKTDGLVVRDYTSSHNSANKKK